MRGLFLLFLSVPMLEMWLLIKVGQVIGAWQTIALVALTAVIGISLLKRQGFKTLMRVQERLNSGEIPATELLEGVLLAVGGALLLTPGFVTDAVGFACLLPVTRKWLAGKIIKSGRFVIAQPGMGGFARGPSADPRFQNTDPRFHRSAREGFHERRDENIIEGEYRRDE
jgi:UPF0716 protein FxsA